MTKVAGIAPGNTTQWDVTEWAWNQAQYLTTTQSFVLVYLATHAFYDADNPEDAEVGQVLRKASYVAEIMAATGLKRDAIRQALTALQTLGYIQREVRKDKGLYGQQPHRIYVLWEFDAMREALRNGTTRLPEELLMIPTRPEPKKVTRPALRLLRECD